MQKYTLELDILDIARIVDALELWKDSAGKIMRTAEFAQMEAEETKKIIDGIENAVTAQAPVYTPPTCGCC